MRTLGSPLKSMQPAVGMMNPVRYVPAGPTRVAVRAALVACVACGILFGGIAPAQAYPDRPVRLIVPYGAGGNADTLARIVAERLGQALGQQFVVDNRPGANSAIGAELAAKAAPDGYTLLYTASPHAINAGLRELPFDAVQDFAPISLVGSTSLILAISSSLPATSVKDLVGLARARPGALSYASAGNGSSGHLAGALFNSLTGVNMVHVPYKAT